MENGELLLADLIAGGDIGVGEVKSIETVLVPLGGWISEGTFTKGCLMWERGALMGAVREATGGGGDNGEEWWRREPSIRCLFAG